MDYLRLVNEAKLESGRSGGDLATVVGAAGDDLRLCRNVANAWDKIQRFSTEWRWMRSSALMSITAGQVTQDPASNMLVQPANTAALTDFRDWRMPKDDYTITCLLPANPTNEWPLSWLPYDKFRGWFVVGAHEAASPRYWSIAPDNKLVVGPKPDVAHHVRFDYRKSLVPLVLDADEPGMPEDFHMIIVWEALKSLSSFDAAPEVFARANEQYDQMFDDLWSDQGPGLNIGARPLA